LEFGPESVLALFLLESSMTGAAFDSLIIDFSFSIIDLKLKYLMLFSSTPHFLLRKFIEFNRNARGCDYIDFAGG